MAQCQELKFPHSAAPLGAQRHFNERNCFYSP